MVRKGSFFFDTGSMGESFQQEGKSKLIDKNEAIYQGENWESQILRTERLPSGPYVFLVLNIYSRKKCIIRYKWVIRIRKGGITTDLFNGEVEAKYWTTNSFLAKDKIAVVPL